VISGTGGAPIGGGAGAATGSLPGTSITGCPGAGVSPGTGVGSVGATGSAFAWPAAANAPRPMTALVSAILETFMGEEVCPLMSGVVCFLLKPARAAVDP
jgi:hypothetical protein